MLRAGRLICMIVSIGLYCLTGVAFGQEFTFKGGIKKDALSFQLVRNLIVIPMYINDRGPFNFILDTGVGPLIITDTGLVDSLGIKNLVPYKLLGAGTGSEFEAFVTTEIVARVGVASIPYIPSVLIVNAPFDLSSYVGVPIHGILGYYFFNSFLVKINYGTKRLVFYDPNSSKKRKGERIPIDFIDQKPYITVGITTNLADTASVDAHLLLDTGASHAISLETMGEEAFPTPPKTIDASLGVGLNGLINGKIGRIDQLGIGNFSFKNVVASFPNYEDVAAKTNTKDRNGTIGGELLTRFRMLIDYNGGAIYLKRNRHYRDAFEHDMSGLEIYLEFGAVNHYFISRVEKGSPAEEAGLKIHDEIVMINFKSVKNESLEEIYHILKSGGKKSVVVEVLRKGIYHLNILHLQPRI